MKIHLAKAIFVNRVPFDNLTIDFSENEIAVLTAANGKGKTTILSHITDAFVEMAKPHFQDFEGRENKLYRVSSALHNIDTTTPSFVYLRFITADGPIDYVDILNKCTEEEYNNAIALADKLPFQSFSAQLDQQGFVKWSTLTNDRNKAKTLFNNNILTYFPSYRHETPGYLNDPYKIKVQFKNASGFSDYLKNPIEVVTGLPGFANWIMDVVLDLRQSADQHVQILFTFLNVILTQTMISKNLGNLRFGIGPRGFGSTRIQILQNIENGPTISPTIFNLSSGESSILCMFGELLRQADNNGALPNGVTGIVLIDEIDKHLHIKLQKESLPLLFQLYPNVQFVVSSHSPFLNMGLAGMPSDRAKIVDLSNLGVSRNPTSNDLYQEVYQMMITENERFKDMYETLQASIQGGALPLIITEGKTDVKHISKAKERLGVNDFDIEFFNPVDGDWGDSKLKILLEQLAKLPQPRKIIGVFDRDVPSIVSDIERNNQPYKSYGNNVFAFCIPKPASRASYNNVSIEFYYTDVELKTKSNGKCLYFDNELNFDSKRKPISAIDNPAENLDKKIWCENIGDLNWIHSKTRFAELIESDDEFAAGFDFTAFNAIFDSIRIIIEI